MQHPQLVVVAHQLGPIKGPLISEDLCFASSTFACQTCVPGGALDGSPFSWVCHLRRSAVARRSRCNNRSLSPRTFTGPCDWPGWAPVTASRTACGSGWCCWPWPWAAPAPRGPAAGQRSPVPGSCLPTQWASAAAPGCGAQPVLVPRGVCCLYHWRLVRQLCPSLFVEKRLIPKVVGGGSVSAPPSPPLAGLPSAPAGGPDHRARGAGGPWGGRACRFPMHKWRPLVLGPAFRGAGPVGPALRARGVSAGFPAGF